MKVEREGWDRQNNVRQVERGGGEMIAEIWRDDHNNVMQVHQTDTACSWLVCHSATVGGTVRGYTVQIVSTYPASPEARPPSFLGKPAVRSRSMAGGAPTPCGRH